MNNNWKPGDVCICVRSRFPENLGKQVILEEFLPIGDLEQEIPDLPRHYTNGPLWRVFCEAGWKWIQFESDPRHGLPQVTQAMSVPAWSLMKIGDGDVQQTKTIEKSKELETA